MADTAVAKEVPGALDQAFTGNLLDSLQGQFAFSEDLKSRLQQDLTRMTPPRRSELSEPMAAERLHKENRQLLGAFLQAITAIPRNQLPESLRHREGNELTAANLTADLMVEILQQLEGRLGVSHLAQLYAGTLNFFDPKLQRSQAMPINWDGLRFRLLAAAADDLTPRSHLNYFCSYASRVIELLSDRGFSPAELRAAAGETIRTAREAILLERQAAVTAKLQEALHQLADVLRQIQTLMQEIFENVGAVRSAADEATFADSITGVRERHTNLVSRLSEVEEAGVSLPTGLRDRLKVLLGVSRNILQADQSQLDAPGRFATFLRQIQLVRKQAQAVAFEFRRIRRRTALLLRRSIGRFGRQMDEIPLTSSIRMHGDHALVRAAREMIWGCEDTSYAMEIEEAQSAPECILIKAAMLAQRSSLPAAIQAMEKVIDHSPLDLMRFRSVGKTLLGIVYQVLQHASPQEIAAREEHPVWAAIADLADAYDCLSQWIEGDERLHLRELPDTLAELRSAVGRQRPNLVLSTSIFAAIDRETKCQEGAVRLSIPQRVDSLAQPLMELVRISLDLSDSDPALDTARRKALRLLGVTREKESDHSSNYLAEIAVIPLILPFLPQAPRYGRSRSELEKRLQFGPVRGVLPSAIVFGIRQPHSLSDLGRQEEAKEREQQAWQLVNRSGLIGQLLGIHPLWEEILDSDAAEAIAAEMRPLFLGDAGQGFLARITSDNEEYLELNRLDDQERIEEAALLIEVITAPDGMAGLLAAIHQGACLLAGPELAQGIQNHRREFLYNQREFLNQRDAEDPTELLLPSQVFFDQENWELPFLELLRPLSPREQELWLLQMHHRKFLHPDLLVPLIRALCESTTVFKKRMGDLYAELFAQFVWFTHYGNRHPTDRATALWVLEHLDMDEAIRAVHSGLPRVIEAGNRVQYLNSLRANLPQTRTGRILAFLRGATVHLQQLERTIRQDIDYIARIGLKRESRLLAKMLVG